jgi:dihydrofolate reductase
MALDSGILDEMYITQVDERYDAETFFPSFEEDKWDSEILFDQEKDAQHEAAFTVKKYTRKA